MNTSQRRSSDRPRYPARPPLPEQDPNTRTVVGLQPVRECVRARASDIQKLMIAAGENPKLAALERFARDQGVANVQRVPKGDLDRLARGLQHQGAMAECPLLELATLESVLDKPDLLAIALDRVQDPQNFGAVIRSAVATSEAPVLWGENASAPLSPATFRASAGAIEHATLCRVPSLTTALQAAKDQGIAVVGLAARGECLLSELDLKQPTVLVLGSEGSGLQPAVRRACTVQASILRPKLLDSLNASVAAAIAL